VVAGDVRAIGFLQEQLGHDQETIAVEIDSRPTVSLDDIVDDLDGVVAAYSGQTTEDLLATFREERGQGDLAADGVEPTLAALRKAQVDTLLLAREVSGGDVWFSASNRAQVARDRTTLTDLGHDDATAGPLSDVLVCAALASGAQVRALPDLSAEHGPSEGVGALLRFRTSG
jgi:hypothetical protein